MSTVMVGEEVPANPSNEEPASKKIRLDDEPTLNTEGPDDNSSQDDVCTQAQEANKIEPTQVRYH